VCTESSQEVSKEGALGWHCVIHGFALLLSYPERREEGDEALRGKKFRGELGLRGGRGRIRNDASGPLPVRGSTLKALPTSMAYSQPVEGRISLPRSRGAQSLLPSAYLIVVQVI
jgi:hypothetical protein